MALFCLTFWQQTGNIKNYYNGIPRLVETSDAAGSNSEAGLPKGLRNLRIAYAWMVGIAVIGTFLVFFARPKRAIRTALNFLFVILFLGGTVVAWIAFGVGLGNYKNAARCQPLYRFTFQKCAPWVAYAIAAITLDAAVATGSILSLLLVAINTVSNHWKLQPRDWEEAVADTHEMPKERAPGERGQKNVSLVKKWLTALALLFTGGSLAALVVFLILLHEGRDKEYFTGARGRTDSSLNPYSMERFELNGWPVKNTRLRYGAVAIGLLSILFNFIPFRSKTIAYIFGFIYLSTAVICFCALGFDLHALNKATNAPCPPAVDGATLVCNRGSFQATAALDFIAAFWLVLYVIIEYVIMQRRMCQHCDRPLLMAELIKHESTDCKARPVRCEVCAKSMTFKEFEGHQRTCSTDHVRCKNCGTMVAKWSVKSHQESCPRWPVPCTMCEDVCQRSDMPHHVMICPNRPSSCDACGETFRSRDMEAHRAVCGEVVVSCELCDDQMQRFRLQQHQQFDCPKRLLQCDKCGQLIPRFRYERHLERDCMH